MEVNKEELTNEIILTIEQDWNRRRSHLNKTDEGWDCTCQGFNVKKKKYEKGESDEKPFCSHILAVKQFKFIEENNQ